MKASVKQENLGLYNKHGKIVLNDSILLRIVGKGDGVDQCRGMSGNMAS
jgi:hypothetical protein